ncbi:MAG: hypothetical protein GY797_11170, partial [Deltaproteobacteria bacterium]|nr:hypothetical protein [Deltaproteobacteria bacterium]
LAIEHIKLAIKADKNDYLLKVKLATYLIELGEYKKAKRQLVNRAILRLQQCCGDASRALAEVCRDKDAPASARVSAAREILGNAFNGHSARLKKNFFN